MRSAIYARSRVRKPRGSRWCPPFVRAVLVLVVLARAAYASPDQETFEIAHKLDHSGDTAAAIAAYEEVATKFPRSPYTLRAVFRSAELYAKVAQFEKAAMKFEAYAERYAGEMDALRGLTTAIAYRRALGHHDLVRRDLDLVQKRYGRSKPQDVAEIMLEHARTLDGDELVKQLERYLKMFG